MAVTGFWQRCATVLAILVLLEGVALAWLVSERKVADARADALQRAYATTQVVFQAAVTASDVRIAAAEDTTRQLSSEVDRLRSVADSAQRLQDALESTLTAALPDTLLPVFESLRAATALQRGAFLSAIDSLHAVVRLQGRVITEYKDQVAKYEARLAEALVGWEASERARRPSVLTWATRAVAGYGLVRLTVDIVKAVVAN